MTSQTFADLGVPAPLVDVLASQGKNDAFPIQADTLPDTLAGRDVLGRGKTGSGKTLAFSLPLVARLAGKNDRRRGRKPRALVLAPTRELANQIDEVIKPLAAAYGLVTTTVYGGVNQKRQVDAFNGGVDILVACPGRLEDLIGQGHASLDDVEITVLDEAHSHVAAMTHHVFAPADADAKKDLVQTLASGTARRILFMRTKHQAKKLAKALTAAGIPSVDLHGNLSQPQRDRNLAAFGDGRAKVLVATDVAARGVHVDGVELVVHVDPPVEHKAYLHRSGRTARAGTAGDVVTIMLPEQRRDTLDILRKAKIDVTPTPVTPASPEVVALVGEVAPYVKPEPIVEPQRGGGRSQGANAQRKRAARAETQPAPARAGEGGGRRRRGRGAGASVDAAPAPRTSQGGGRGGQRSSGAASRTQGSGRTASGTPTIGMVVGSRSPRTNRRAQG